jgi:hypothetical protein
LIRLYNSVSILARHKSELVGQGLVGRRERDQDCAEDDSRLEGD